MAIQQVQLHDNQLRVLSVFLTVDGECNKWGQGTWSVFVRLSGCQDIYCRWCDTKYSWPVAGQVMDINKVLGLITQHECGKVTITGGEPLQQWYSLRRLLNELIVVRNFNVSIETSGCVPIPASFFTYNNLCIVMDYKLSSAQVQLPPVLTNYLNLSEQHFVKFVIASIEDYNEACYTVHRLRYEHNCLAQMWFSPCAGEVSPVQLFEWMKERAPSDVGLNVQLHKVIFSDDARAEENGEEDIDFSARAR